MTGMQEANRLSLEKELANCSDVLFRRLHSAGDSLVWVVYSPGMIDKELLEKCLLLLLPAGREPIGEDEDSPVQAAGRMAEVRSQDELVSGILSGKVAVLLEDGRQALISGLVKLPARNIQEPEAEPIVRGPREGFIEQLDTNMSLIRKRLPTSRLKMETLAIGLYTKTKLAIVYIEGVAAEGVVQEVRSRLADIDIDGIVDSGYIEEFIEDVPFTPFPQVQHTERPDFVTAALLDGNVAIMTDGSPGVLIVPMTLWSAVQSGEDYYDRFFHGTFVRWIRLLFMALALFLPATYVAISTYHPEMIPTNLLVSLAGAREAIPFPALVEALLMELTFEALREAGIRLPKQVGSAVSIVGALVIGQAAVDAGIVSAPMVIVVSITGIASFTIPRFNMALGIRVLRFPMILLGGTLGLFGISIGFLGLLIHLSSLRSFGTAYLAPVSPLSLSGLKDVFIRAPHWAKSKRPAPSNRRNRIRVPGGQKPSPNRS